MIITIDTAGRIVIPAPMRKYLGLETGQEVKIEVIDQKIVITKIESKSE